MPITSQPFGLTPTGAPATLFTLTNAAGAFAAITNYGAHLTQLHIPDKSGQLSNIILGFAALDGYLGDHPYFGSTVGRYANRIAKGQFTLNGRHYQLATNDGPNHLHGGVHGFHRQLWKSTVSDKKLSLSYHAHDGEEGYPGDLDVTVTFSLNDTHELRIDYLATCNSPTVLNLTNHTYFNLTGPGCGTILNHQLQIHADHYLPTDASQIPTGTVSDVSDTPFDFCRTRAIGQNIAQVPGGYDHNYCLNHPSGQLSQAATVFDPQSGRIMEVLTDQLGLQLYTGNKLDGSLTGLGGTYQKHSALCLETQHYPDSPNHPDFPTTTLNPGRTFRSTTIYRFSIKR